jgi:hypothetical protein
LIKCSGRAGRQIVEHDEDALRIQNANLHEFPHDGSEVNGSAAVGDFDLAPGPMRIKEDKQFMVI